LQRPNWTRCSVITEGLLIKPGQLSSFDLAGAVKRIRKRLERSAIHDRIVLGGLDVSLNLESNKMSGWQFHLYLLIEGKNDANLQAAVKKAFPPEPTALAAYDFEEVTDPLETITYTYKALIQRLRYKDGARLILSGVRRNRQRLVFTPKKPEATPRA
jgi:hypothetical protein